MFSQKKYTINLESTIRDSINLINQNSAQVSLVVDAGYKLLGIVTDGDIRRGILNGLSLEDSVTKIMTSKPATVDENCGRSKSLELMNEKLIHHILLLINMVYWLICIY